MKHSMSAAISIWASLALSLVVAACSVSPGASASHEAPTAASSQPTVMAATPTRLADGPTASAVLPSSAATTPAPPEPATSEPPTEGSAYVVTYDWAVPWDRVTIPHTVLAPVAPAPAPPLPYLVAVDAGDHLETTPGFQRISFYFRGAFPQYDLDYVPALTAEGSGAAIPLEGNAVLRVGFVSAQAHDSAGASTVETAPENPLGFHNLRSYGFAGDYEGYVTFGLGIQVAPDSDQVLHIRAGEHTQPDGAGGVYYVVHVDVQNG